MSNPAILRRAEQKRKRWYKRRARRRNPLERALKAIYSDVARSAFASTFASICAMRTPFLDSLLRRDDSDATGHREPPGIRWGGNDVYLDIALSGPTTTRATSQKGGRPTGPTQRLCTTATPAGPTLPPQKVYIA